MNNKELYSIFYLIIAVLALFACKKSDPNNPPGEPDTSSPSFILFSGNLGASNTSCYENPNGRILLCGNRNGQIAVNQIDQSGSLIWNKQFDGGYIAVAHACTQDAASNSYVCGQVKNIQNQDDDIFLVKLNAIGDTLWTRSYGVTNGDEIAQAILISSDGNLVLSGMTNATTDGLTDFFLTKLDLNGNQIWYETWANTGEDIFHSFQELDNGNFAISGGQRKTGAYGGILVQFDLLGVYTTHFTIGSYGENSLNSFIENADGTFWGIGETTVGPDKQSHLFKFDGQGTVSFNKQFGQQQNQESPRVLRKDADNNLWFAGKSFYPSTGQSDGFFSKIDSIGNEILTKQFNCMPNGEVWNLLFEFNGNVIYIGNQGSKTFFSKTNNKAEFI
jgi:hypothetical protein